MGRNVLRSRVESYCAFTDRQISVGFMPFILHREMRWLVLNICYFAALVAGWLVSNGSNLAECCFTFTETGGLLGKGAQDGHLDFHTPPELCVV